MTCVTPFIQTPVALNPVCGQDCNGAMQYAGLPPVPAPQSHVATGVLLPQTTAGLYFLLFFISNTYFGMLTPIPQLPSTTCDEKNQALCLAPICHPCGILQVEQACFLQARLASNLVLGQSSNHSIRTRKSFTWHRYSLCRCQRRTAGLKCKVVCQSTICQDD